MLGFIFLLALTLGAVTPSEVPAVKLQRGNCPLFWYSFGGRCYKYIATRMTWADAELYCLSQKTNLVSIYSLEEHNFVKSLINNFDPANGLTWIGLSDIHKEGRWMWSDGCRVKFFFWEEDQPDDEGRREHCAHMNLGSQMKWNDNQCSYTIPFVCASRIVCPQ
ncbi:hypothetical protein Q5P01_018203 [Channa striata]|uniref:C-type lectin domain-containing protein n=1 Tax=Channa striata TaxID=64152 RepID=A0AA88S9I4_CHASR|nr:hypothetical protein Q5P01_018203 [Channa striata]